MRTLRPLRKTLALSAILPLSLIGLTACSGDGDSESESRDREPAATQDGGAGETGSGGDGGGLPFPFPGAAEQNGDAQAGGEESSNAGADGSGANGDAGSGGSGSGGSGGSGGGSGDVVVYGDIDLSDVNWESMCSSGSTDAYIIASDGDIAYDAEETGPTLMASTDEQGEPDSLMLSTGDVSGSEPYLFWSSTSGEGDVTMTFDNGTFQASGTAFDMSDYEYSNPLEFEIRMTCDTVY
ncbi:hypothetical protein [Gulosibacter sp. 10]|uniref:hypothetical protein n=1 Tax=Gulosibacter sp. 10 TaxID=1255570 RepID=UPI00097E81D0|nr:hypothetical protein [Gulosibacter sp. 10]SJM50620.1 PE-PGRS FAMILY PROTEIN [Gulosibacter sp. 10]